MAKTKRKIPGRTPFRQAMNMIGQLIFERGLRGDLDMAVTSRRIGEATAITVLYPEGVMNFTVTDAELESELTPGQREARRLRLDSGEGI